MPELDDILNWRRIDGRITTSGQPSEAELAAIRACGVTHVLNLGPHHNTGALADEPGTVAQLGMTYIYIPVDFDDPTPADFEAFRAALSDTAPNLIHVHCIYNARVSAFFHKLLGTDAAAANMDSIWRPGGVWAAFLGDPDAVALPHRYAGDDY